MSSGSPVHRRTVKPKNASVFKRHALICAIYAILSLLLTWPLAPNITTHLPGDGIDDPALAWNLWWIFERLVAQVNPAIFDSDWMFFPIGINLGFYTLTPLNGLLSVPLQSAASRILSTNLILLSTYLLGGYGTYLLTRSLLQRRRQLIEGPTAQGDAWMRADDWIGLVAGLTYAFASSKLFYTSLGQFNISSSQWIPFCLLYMTRIYPARSPKEGLRAAAMAGLFLVFQAWAELTYATFLFLFVALYFLYVLVQWTLERWAHNVRVPGAGSGPTEQRESIWPLLVRFVLLGGVTVVGLIPFLGAMVPDLLLEGDFFASGGGFADVFSADLMGFLVPTRLHPLLGDWVAQLPFSNDKGQHLYVGYVALLLALLGFYGLVRSRHAKLRLEGWFWALATGLFFWLTLGPEVRWAGTPLGIPGPFVLVSRLPFFSGNRYPSRYSVMVMVCVAVLLAYGLAWAADALQARRAAAGRSRSFSAQLTALLLATFVALLFLAEHLSSPLPLNDFRVPPIYQEIAAYPRATLLELPTGWRNGARVMGRSDTLIMMQQWYQTDHGWRRLGGNTSRNPAYKFQYFSEAPLVGDLIALMNADRPHIGQAINAEWDTLVERDRPIAGEVLDFFDIDLMTVHVDHAPAELLRFVEEVLPVALVDEWQGADWQGRPSTIRLYAVDADQEQSDTQEGWEIDLSDHLGTLYLAEGWSTVAADGFRHALRADVELMLDLPTSGGTLMLEVDESTTVERLTVNGTTLGLEEVGEDGWIGVVVPSGLAEQPLDRLALQLGGEPLAWAQNGLSSNEETSPVGTSGISVPADLSILARSAGEEAGDFAQIFVNGVDRSRNGRGYNLVALDSAGTVLESVTFDTFVASAEADAMAEWIRQWPAGTIIAGAVRDEASTQLTDGAVSALQYIGLASDLRGMFRQGHAFVGLVGARAGMVPEESVLLRPATAGIGSKIDGVASYGRIGRLQLIPDGATE